MTPTEIAGYVCDHLNSRGINVVLSGGACVSYCCKGQYVSMDLDLVNAGLAKRDKIKAAMVAQANRIDIKDIERWSKVEGKHDEFQQIEDRLLKKKA